MDTPMYAVEVGSARPRAVRESVPPVLPKPWLLDRAREALRVRHYSRRTEEAYVAWIRRYIFFHGKRHPAELGGPDVTRFLSALAVDGHMAASTQNQALSALLFLYRDVLGVELPWLDDIVRAKRRERPSIVLSRDEIRALMQRLDGAPRLMACLLYGAGLRVMECCRLRVQDVDFGSNQIVVRGGKGDKDRTTMLPTMAKAETHLLEDGQDIRTVQEMLGHRDVSTAMISGSSGYRLEWDQRSGPHINVGHHKVKGPHFKFRGNEQDVRAKWRQLYWWDPRVKRRSSHD